MNGCSGNSGVTLLISRRQWTVNNYCRHRSNMNVGSDDCILLLYFLTSLNGVEDGNWVVDRCTQSICGALIYIHKVYIMYI